MIANKSQIKLNRWHMKAMRFSKHNIVLFMRQQNRSTILIQRDLILYARDACERKYKAKLS